MRKVVLATTVILITAAFLASCSEDQDKNAPTTPGIPTDSTTAPWDRTYGTLNNDYAVAVATGDSGEIFVLGDSREGSGESDILLSKISTTGRLIWQKTFDYSLDEIGGSIFRNPDGSLLLIGTAFTAGRSDGKVVCIEVDSDGQEIDYRFLDEPAHVMGAVRAVPTGGGYVMQGNAQFSSASYSGTQAAFVMRVTNAGNVSWLRYFAGQSCTHPQFNVQGTGSAEAITCDPVTGNITFAWFYTSWIGYGMTDCGPPQEFSELVQLSSDGTSLWKTPVGRQCPTRAMSQVDDNHVVLFTNCAPFFKKYTLTSSLEVAVELPFPGAVQIKSTVVTPRGVGMAGFVRPGEGLYYGMVGFDGQLIFDTSLAVGTSGNAIGLDAFGNLIIVGNSYSADSSMQMYVLKVDPL